MRSTTLLCSFFLILTGCATYNPIPDGYTGPTCPITDSSQSVDSSRARFFYVSEIDGNRVENNLTATRQANYGRGFMMTPASKYRDIPAKKVVLKLEARVEYAAPILALTSSSKAANAEQVIELDAKPGAAYVVRGILSESRSEVWLEDIMSGERVGKPLATK